VVYWGRASASQLKGCGFKSLENLLAIRVSRGIESCLCNCVDVFSVSGTSEETDISANCVWLVTNSKPCSNCKSPIQKNEGCNHMKCSKVNVSDCNLSLSFSLLSVCMCNRNNYRSITILWSHCSQCVEARVAPWISRWGVNALEGGGINAVKTLILEKVGGAWPPPTPMVAPPLLY